LRNIIRKIEEKRYFNVYYKGKIESMLLPKLSYSRREDIQWNTLPRPGRAALAGKSWGENVID